MIEVFRRPAVRCDLVEHFAYLYDDVSEVVADRFLGCIEASFCGSWQGQGLSTG